MAQRAIRTTLPDGRIALNNIIDKYTGESIQLVKLDALPDGVSADGIIYFETSTSEYGTEYWVRTKFESDKIINVRWFGAMGDGVADDTDALQEALSILSWGHLGLIIPTGKYIISSPISVTGDHISVSGGGELYANGLTTSNAFVTINSNYSFFSNLVVTGSSRVGQYIVIAGNYNTVSNVTAFAPEKMTSPTLSYQYHALRVTGTFNKVEKCELYNQAAGVNIRNKSNTIKDCYIHDNQQGIYLSASCRDVIVEGNSILNNDASNDDGSDGIYGQRNVSRITISNNVISNSGEHGIYFQGDSSVIIGNSVSNCYGDGIKVASYNTQLYWHPDETPLVPYYGHDNIVSNNICLSNNTGSETGGGIYLQSPVRRISVIGNTVVGGVYGIRTAYPSTTEGSENHDIILSNNIISSTSNRAMWVPCQYGLRVVNNHSPDNGILLGGVSGVSTSDAYISGNNVLNISTNNTVRAVIRDNIFESVSLADNASLTTFVGNTIKNQISDINLRRLLDFSNNTVDITAQIVVTVGNSSIKRMVSNVINCHDPDLLATDYVINPAFNLTANGLDFSNNRINITASPARAFRWFGDGLTISNNWTNSVAVQAIAIHCTNSVITNNIGDIILNSGTSGCVLSGNRGTITGFLSANKIDEIAASADDASAPSASYDQAEAQAILDELRDLKTKMRTAGLLAT